MNDIWHPPRGYIWTLEIKENTLCTAQKRNDQWSTVIRGRLQSCNDLVAEEAVYHRQCLALFFSKHCSPSESSTNKETGRKTHEGKQEFLMSYANGWKYLVIISTAFWSCTLSCRKWMIIVNMGLKYIQKNIWKTNFLSVIEIIFFWRRFLEKIEGKHHRISATVKIQNGYAFLVPANPGCPGKKAINRL